MRPLLLASFVVVAFAAIPQGQGGRATLHVTDADAGVPIARAAIASASTDPLPRTFSDEHGVATVDVARPRRVRVIKPGYVPESLELKPENAQIEVRLTRGAAISGRVTDTVGAPVAERAIVVSQPGGAQPPRQMQTDDLGQYRIGTLAAGTYVVAVTAVPTASPPAAVADAPAVEGLPHTVVVRRGEDVGGIDFVVPPRSTCRPQAVPAVMGPAVLYASIAGRVTVRGGAPLPCVDVVATRAGTAVSSAVTDPAGRYVLPYLRAGTYLIEFKRAGFMTAQWGQTESGTPGRPVPVRDHERLTRFDVTLVRGGAITGTLADEYGEAAEGVTVRALQLREQGERAIAIGVRSTATDDRGRYRLYGLPAGRYIVATAASADLPDRPGASGYAPAYYPGVVDIASATPVAVDDQREQPWIDFPRRPTRVATVTGIAVDSRGEPVSDRVLLVASQRSGAVIAETHSADVKGPDGAFTIVNVPPGDYVLQATTKRTPEDPPEFGMQYVTVFDADPLPARVQTRAGIGLQGRLVVEGVPPVSARSFTLEVVPVDWDQTSLLAGVQRVTPEETGVLAVPGIAGPRRFVLSSAPTGWYLKSVRVRGRDVTDNVMGFPPGGLGFIRDLEVVVSNRGAIVEGDVLDGTTLAPEALVVAFSTNPDHWFRGSRFVKSARSNPAGEFRIEGVADGDYFVVAIDPLVGSAADALHRRDFLESLMTAAKRVRAREGEALNVSLSLSHR